MATASEADSAPLVFNRQDSLDDDSDTQPLVAKKLSVASAPEPAPPVPDFEPPTRRRASDSQILKPEPLAIAQSCRCPDCQAMIRSYEKRQREQKRGLRGKWKAFKRSCTSMYSHKQSSVRKNSVFVDAACRGNLEYLKHVSESGGGLLRRLSRSKFDYNVQSLTGQTALIGATISGKRDVMEYLLAKRVDVNVRDNSERTALHYAVCQKSYIVHEQVEHPLAQDLINAGVDLEVKDCFGWTAVQVAVTSRNLAAVYTLKNAGAKLNSAARSMLSPAATDEEEEDWCEGEEGETEEGSDFVEDEEEEEEEGEEEESGLDDTSSGEHAVQDDSVSAKGEIPCKQKMMHVSEGGYPQPQEKLNVA